MKKTPPFIASRNTRGDVELNEKSVHGTIGQVGKRRLVVVKP